MNLRSPSGLLFEFSESGEKERPCLACGHCQMQKVIYEKGQDLGGVCFVCWRLICGPCADKGVCVPWEEMLAKQEAQWESRRSMGLT